MKYISFSRRTINNGRQFVLQTRTDCWILTVKPHRLLFAHRFQPYWQWNY